MPLQRFGVGIRALLAVGGGHWLSPERSAHVLVFDPIGLARLGVERRQRHFVRCLDVSDDIGRVQRGLVRGFRGDVHEVFAWIRAASLFFAVAPSTHEESPSQAGVNSVVEGGMEVCHTSIMEGHANGVGQLRSTCGQCPSNR